MNDLTETNWPGERQRAFWNRANFAKEFVYFIQGDPGTPIKIGYTTDVETRLATLQTGNPQKLRLLVLIPGSKQVEAAFHRFLAKDRVINEWFDGVVVEETLMDALEVSLVIQRIYEARGWLANPFDHLKTIDRPKASRRKRAKVVPIDEGRKARVVGPYTGTGMHRSWRMSQPKESPVTVRFVDPETLRDEAA